MRYIVKVGALPVFQGDIMALEGALSRHAVWDFTIKQCNHDGLQLNAETVYDIASEVEIDDSEAWELCSLFYRTIHKAASIRPCAVMSIAPLSDPEFGWVHYFSPF